MAELSTGTFLALMRNPRTGRTDFRELERGVEWDIKDGPDDPQDCVRRAPSVDAEMTQLVGYDIHGNVRVKVEVALKDAGWWEKLMLRYMRWRFGRPIRLMR